MAADYTWGLNNIELGTPMRRGFLGGKKGRGVGGGGEWGTKTFRRNFKITNLTLNRIAITDVVWVKVCSITKDKGFELITEGPCMCPRERVNKNIARNSLIYKVWLKKQGRQTNRGDFSVGEPVPVADLKQKAALDVLTFGIYVN